MLPDGRRLHLHHGPIDLIIDAEGPAREPALRAASERFETVLVELVPELALLRMPVSQDPALAGAIARRMRDAAAPFAPLFITPMAAVAGAVADTILATMISGRDLTRAYVNNGGDVALHLTGDERFTAAIAAGRTDRVVVTAESPARGIATSGRRGRSLSFGIADGVTVLAPTAAQADAAATMIANAVDLPGSSKITRKPARELDPDSDLGALPVTVEVAPLNATDIDAALDRGRRFADRCLSRGLICAAHLTLAGQAISLARPAAEMELSHA